MGSLSPKPGFCPGTRWVGTRSNRSFGGEKGNRNQLVNGRARVGPVGYILPSPFPRVYNTMNGKQKKCYKGSQGDEGSLLKVRRELPAAQRDHLSPVSLMRKGSQAGSPHTR